ncbi:MAG: arginase [Chloroflexota bacterium]
MQKLNKVRILGVPMDLGQGRRGVDMGPSAVRYAQLQDRLTALGYTVTDSGNVDVLTVEAVVQEEDPSPENEHAHHLNEVVKVCQSIYKTILSGATDGEFTICLGGDHSISMGSVTGIARQRQIGVIWVDAHADYNTPQTSPSGNIHGMPMAVLLGDGPDSLVNMGYAGPKLRAENVVMIGIRSLDLTERQRLSTSGISVFTMTDIDENGMATMARRVLDQLANVDTIHVSLDMDSLDPDIAPGVGTPIPGGLTYREAHLLMEILAASGKVRSMDIVEINPILDNHNQTAELAVALAASLLGQRIL